MEPNASNYTIPVKNSAAILAKGQAQGLRPHVFSKVGDSITASPLFLWPLGVGGLHLEDFAALQPTYDTFMKVHNSFAVRSQAAANGWSTFDLLMVGRVSEQAQKGVCRGDETPLACEYRVTRPAYAFIMIGTNDCLHHVDYEVYKQNLEKILVETLQRGILPILSTIPDLRVPEDNPGRDVCVYAYNDIIRSFTEQYSIPLWDYWAQMQGLPNLGLSDDGIHPSAPEHQETGIFSSENLQYGYTLRNLAALQILDNLTGHE